MKITNAQTTSIMLGESEMISAILKYANVELPGDTLLTTLKLRIVETPGAVSGRIFRLSWIRESP